MRQGRWVWLWLVAAGTLAGAGWSLYRGWISGPLRPEDFTTFVRAGRAVAAGTSPYLVHQPSTFVYPPLFAIVLAPFSHLPVPVLFHWWAVVSLLAFAAAIAMAVWPVVSARAWQLPLLVAFGALTTYHWWPIDFELSLGQSDLLVLCVVAGAGLVISRRRATWAGALVGLGAALKAWPAALVVALWRRTQRRALAAALVVGCTIPAAAFAIGGWSELTAMVDAIRGTAHKRPSYSAWGPPWLLFGHTHSAKALAVSHPLEVVATCVLVSWVVALLVWTLWRGDPSQSLAFWNVVGCIVLLLPFLEFEYTLYLLPLLWLWAARALTSRRPPDVAVFGLLLLWWHFAADPWNVGVYYATPAWRATAPVFLNLGALTLSVVALRTHQPPAAERTVPDANAVTPTALPPSGRLQELTAD